MESNKDKKTGEAYKVLFRIPAILFIAGIVLFQLENLFYKVAFLNPLCTISVRVAVLCFVFSIFPGFILVIIGTIMALRAKSKKEVLLGVVETIVVFLMVMIVYLGAQQ